MSDHYADHQPLPKGPLHSWPSPDRTPGRYCLLEHPAGQPVGILLAGDDGRSIGFAQFSGTVAGAFASQVNMGTQSAYATGASSPERVYEHWSTMATQTINATGHGHTDDMGAVIEYAFWNDALPPQ